MSQMPSLDRPILAADIGGSKIVTAIVSPDGGLVAREYLATLAEEGPQAVIRRMLTAFQGTVARANMEMSAFTHMVIAAAGIIDAPQGVVTVSPNLPGWNNVPLKRVVEQQTGLSAEIVNDANAAALGEHAFGAGRGADNMVYVTVSTGIGGGIIMDGKLQLGACGAAGEVGHMSIEANGIMCRCGNLGCLEMMSSGKAMAREAQAQVLKGARSNLLELAEGDVENITARTLHRAAEMGDALALRVITQAGRYLGVGLVNLINIFNPDAVVIGGGAGRLGQFLLDPAREVVAERAFPLSVAAARIVSSELWDNAAVLGCVPYLRQTSLQARG